MADPIELSLTLDIDKMLVPYGQRYDEDGEPFGGQPQTLESVVLDQAVRQVVAGLDAEVRKGLSDRVRQIRDEVIREAVDPIITEALSGPIFRTNAYGERTGTETTLREIITEHAKSALSLTGRNGRSSYDQTPATQVLIAEVDRAVTSEVKAIVQQVKDETRSAIQTAAAEAIAKAAS